jgi:hypothetical protein
MPRPGAFFFEPAPPPQAESVGQPIRFCSEWPQVESYSGWKVTHDQQVRSCIQFFALLLVHVPAASVVFSTLYLLSDPSPRRYLQLVLHVRARSSASVPALLGQMFLPLISSFLLGESTQLQKGNLSAAERGLSEKGTKFVFCRF